MARRISSFGGTTRGEVTIEQDAVATREVDRDIWFDRDINGRWLVWATAHDGQSPPDDDGQTGAIIVKNADVNAFIELLGELIAEPTRFHHEPTFTGLGAAAEPLKR